MVEEDATWSSQWITAALSTDDVLKVPCASAQVWRVEANKPTPTRVRTAQYLLMFKDFAGGKGTWEEAFVGFRSGATVNVSRTVLSRGATVRSFRLSRMATYAYEGRESDMLGVNGTMYSLVLQSEANKTVDSMLSYGVLRNREVLFCPVSWLTMMMYIQHTTPLNGNAPCGVPQVMESSEYKTWKVSVCASSSLKIIIIQMIVFQL